MLSRLVTYQIPQGTGVRASYASPVLQYGLRSAVIEIQSGLLSGPTATVLLEEALQLSAPAATLFFYCFLLSTVAKTDVHLSVLHMQAKHKFKLIH